MERNIQLIAIQIIRVKKKIFEIESNINIRIFFKTHIVKHMNNNGKQQYKMDK
jgi:hypothetical protein